MVRVMILLLNYTQQISRLRSMYYIGKLVVISVPTFSLGGGLKFSLVSFLVTVKLKKVQCINIKKMHTHMHYMDVYKRRRKRKIANSQCKNAVLFGLVFTVRCCVFICLHDDKYSRCVITLLYYYMLKCIILVRLYTRSSCFLRERERLNIFYCVLLYI